MGIHAYMNNDHSYMHEFPSIHSYDQCWSYRRYVDHSHERQLIMYENIVHRIISWTLFSWHMGMSCLILEPPKKYITRWVLKALWFFVFACFLFDTRECCIWYRWAFETAGRPLTPNLNKLAKLRRHTSGVHFASNSFVPINIV